MRIIFAGTPEIACPSLEKVAEKWTVSGVLTAPDKRSGRGNKVHSSPVKELALSLGLPVIQPYKIDEACGGEVRALKADLLVCVAYGFIFPSSFLELFPLGGINLHPSLLPLFRGPSPIPASLLSGASSGGITVQKLARKMDAGDIIFQQERPYSGEETTLSLTREFGETGGDLVVRSIEALEKDTAKPIPQDHEKATYCSLIKKEDGHILWDQSAEVIDRMIRAYNPWPRCFTSFNGKGLVIHKGKWLKNEKNDPSGACGQVLGVDKERGILVNTKEGVLALEVLQMQAKKVMDFKAFLNGNKDIIGSILGE